MAKKISSPAKAVYIIFALALVFSAMPALAVTLASSTGASANGPIATAYGSDFILNEYGNGTARWVWDNIVTIGDGDTAGVVDYHLGVGNHGAYLKAETTGDYAWVAVLWGCTIGDLTDTELSYWYRNPVNINGLGPIMALGIDTTHDGSPDELAWVNTCPPASATWIKWSVDFTTTLWHTFGHGTGINWDTLVTAVGADAKVVKVLVGYDKYNLPNGTCYGTAFVDDIKVKGRTWDLEPIETDCVKSAFAQGQAGYPIQIEVYDPIADTFGTIVDELVDPEPDGSTTVFNLDKQPRPGTVTAKDVTGALTVILEDPDNKTFTVSAAPPAEEVLLACHHAEADISLDSQPTMPTQLTATTLDDDGNCTETAPGIGEYMYVFITGYTGPGGTGTPINDMLYILGEDTEETTTQIFGSVIADGVDATYSTGSNATAIRIGAINHVWASYQWHQYDTVTVYAQTLDAAGTPTGEQVAVELIEVDEITLEPDKDGGYFKGILYPVTTASADPDPATPTGLERHELYAPHCNTIELKYPLDDPADVFKTFAVDNEPPLFSNESPDPATNDSQPTISVDIDDVKCDVTKDKISLYVSSVNDNPPFDPGDKVAPANFDFTNGTVTYTPPSTLIDGTYYVRVKAADCCWNWGEIDWSFEVESSPPRMIDAITGWGWYQGRPRGPQNLNLRNTIMVVFSERLNPATVEPSDFTVDDVEPVDIEYHDYDGDWPGNCGNNPNGHDYGLVFLYLDTPLYTDDTPTVVQVGVVEDLAGNACDKPYTWTCGELELPQTVISQDGIAPAITVTVTPEDPGYNETVTVTATSSEPLSEAYLFVGEGSPSDYYWDECKPIGWDIFGPDVPCSDPGHVPSTEWDGTECSTCMSRCLHGEWMLMTEGATPYEWTASFTNEMIQNELWFIEVAAHDFTEWWVDMGDDGIWDDYECLPHEKRWKHEKWTQESFLFGAWDVEFVDLCEGWNLISVPWDLVYSSPQELFNVRTNVGVTKVYYYAGGLWAPWVGTALNPVTGVWEGLLTRIEPGKAYWVWVSPPYMELVLHMVEPIGEMFMPPSYLLKEGWNMIGYVEMADRKGSGGEGSDDDTSSMHDDLDMRHYFESIEDQATHMYAYDPCEVWYDTGRGFNPWIRFDAGSGEDPQEKWHYREMRVGCGYWLFVTEDVLFAP